jgi:hypothetical protein
LKEAANLMAQIGYRADGYITKQRLQSFPDAISVCIHKSDHWGDYL